MSKNSGARYDMHGPLWASDGLAVLPQVDADEDCLQVKNEISKKKMFQCLIIFRWIV